jgi:hypothetical protein
MNQGTVALCAASRGAVFTTIYDNALHGCPQHLQMLSGLADQDAGFWQTNDLLIRAAVFGGPRLVENAQKAKTLLSGSTG